MRKKPQVVCTFPLISLSLSRTSCPSMLTTKHVAPHHSVTNRNSWIARLHTRTNVHASMPADVITSSPSAANSWGIHAKRPGRRRRGRCRGLSVPSGRYSLGAGEGEGGKFVGWIVGWRGVLRTSRARWRGAQLRWPRTQPTPTVGFGHVQRTQWGWRGARLGRGGGVVCENPAAWLSRTHGGTTVEPPDALPHPPRIRPHTTPHNQSPHTQ